MVLCVTGEGVLTAIGMEGQELRRQGREITSDHQWALLLHPAVVRTTPPMLLPREVGR